jgi:hypothetical protein
MSVYFSNLPEYTGNTYNGYVIWNDSGETTTYKTKLNKLNVDNLSVISGNISTDNVDNTIVDNTLPQLVFGSNNLIGTSNKEHIVIGDGNNATGGSGVGGFEGSFIFGKNNDASSITLRGAIVIGTNNVIAGGGAVIIGEGITAQANGAIVIGGSLNSVISSYGIVIGGYDNDVTGGEGVGIFGGAFNKITGSDRGHIIGGLSNTISGTSNRSTIINGQNNTINNLERVVILGTSGLTANESDTTYTQNHKSLGQTYNGYYDNGSGSTFTIDWNNGNSQKIFMTGDISLTFTNVKSGGQYRLQIVNGGTHSITATTASGFTILCEGGVVPNITNNGVDLCILEGMGTDLLVRHFADFSAP